MEPQEIFLSQWICSHFDRGEVFFAEDLEGAGLPPQDVRVYLSRFAREGSLVIRLARGVYCLPRLDEHSMKTIYPTPESLADAFARRWRVRILPCGAQAAYLSGLTSLKLYPLTYLSDGSEQVFHLSEGREIRFLKRRSMKAYHFRSERLRNLSEGMRHLGEKYIGDFERGVIADTLLSVSQEDFVHDVKLCPSWIRHTFLELR